MSLSRFIDFNKNCIQTIKIVPIAYKIITKRNFSTSDVRLRADLAYKKKTRVEWNRAITDGEKCVGYPNTYLSFQWVFSDEMANVAVLFRKLIGSTHPLVNTAKILMYNQKNNLQTWGLMILLLSKSFGYDASFVKDTDIDRSAGILNSQRTIAEATEMIRISNMVHQGLINLQPQTQAGDDLSKIDNDISFGNKTCLLFGDYLIGNATAEISRLRNQEIVELILSAVGDLAEGEFIGDRDEQNVPLPEKPAPDQRIDEDYLTIDAADNLKPLSFKGIKGDPEKEWTVRHILSAGRLLGKSCQGVLKLAGLHDATQRQGYLFGRHLALAWQACIDLEPFHSNEFSGGSFSLVSAPVIYHLEYNPSLYSEIEKGISTVENIDYGKIFNEVINGPGIEQTRNLHTKHSIAAMDVLSTLPPSEARTTLQNIIIAMQDL